MLVKFDNTVQNPFNSDFEGYFGGATSSDFGVYPIYLHLVKEELGELTLNRFLVNLMGHLTFYRKRSSVISESMLDKHDFECMAVQGYQFNLSRNLVPVEIAHQQGNLLPSLIKYILYSVDTGLRLGQIAWMPWQDGGALSYSGKLPPEFVFRPYFDEVKSDIMIIPGRKHSEHWLSAVIPLSKERFIEISRRLQGNVVLKFYDGDENKEFPDTLDKYNIIYPEHDKP